jgi:metal-sulfur cluster biosynthetic enzyme
MDTGHLDSSSLESCLHVRAARPPSRDRYTPESLVLSTWAGSKHEIAAANMGLMATEDAVVSEDDVNEALEEVIDPELGLDFVSLGLVYDVEIEGGDVYITFTLTTPACPIGPQVTEQMKEFVGELEGVEGVHPKMVFDPPWSPEMMSEDAKFALGF